MKSNLTKMNFFQFIYIYFL